MPASLAVLNTSPFFIAFAFTRAYASAPIHTRADADATRDVVAFAPTFTMDAVPALFTCVSDARAPAPSSNARPKASAKIAFASSTSRAVVVVVVVVVLLLVVVVVVVVASAIAGVRATRVASARARRTASRAHRVSVVIARDDVTRGGGQRFASTQFASPRRRRRRRAFSRATKRERNTRRARRRARASSRAVDAACAMLERAMGEIRASVRDTAWAHDDVARENARAREMTAWNDGKMRDGARDDDARSRAARAARVECELESVDVGEFGDGASDASDASARGGNSAHARDGDGRVRACHAQLLPSSSSPSSARGEIRRLRARCERLEREASAARDVARSRAEQQAMASSNVDIVAQDVLVNEIVHLRQHVTRVNAERDRLIELSNDLRAALHARTRGRAARAVSAMRDAGETSAANDAEDAICTLWDHNQHLLCELRRAQAVIRGRDRLIERERNREPTAASVIPIVEATPAIKVHSATKTMAPESSQRETASQKLKLQNAIRRAKARRTALAAPKVRNWNERDQ